MLVAAAKILAAKAGTSISLAQLPCQPTCLVSPPALSAHLPCQPTCLVGPPALFVPTTRPLILQTNIP